ncbi:hypothetical protein ACHQM5_021372 [Ranunculus cassubicifolius]
MYSKFDRFSSLGMSNESSIFIIETEKDSNTIQVDVFRLTDEDNDEIKEEKCMYLQKELKIMSSVQEKEVNDDDDGFRTPTSLRHKIPVIQQCPPAPRKPKSLPSRKRKAACLNLPSVRNDLSKKIEMLVPPAFLDELSRKIKKAKGDTNM